MTSFPTTLGHDGELPEWPNGTDCKSVVLRLRWFESTTPHYTKRSFVGASTIPTHHAGVAQLVEH
jgi:hypothetical protein